MRTLAFALFGLAAALALAAIWIHFTSLRSVDVSTVDVETARRLIGVQTLGQAAGAVLVLGLIVLFGRRDPDQSTAPPAQPAASRRGLYLLIVTGVVLMGLLPWLASLFFRVLHYAFAQAPPSELEALADLQMILDASFWPMVAMAALPGLIVIAIGIVKLQRPHSVPPPAPRRRSDPSDLGTGGPWAMILAAIGVGVGTPLFLRWQLAQLRGTVPDADTLAFLQCFLRFAGGISLVIAVVLFLFGVGLLRRVLRDRKPR